MKKGEIVHLGRTISPFCLFEVPDTIINDTAINSNFFATIFLKCRLYRRKGDEAWAAST